MENAETNIPAFTPFPAIHEGQIGSATVRTVNARDLHRALGVGKQFGNWIVDRIDQFAFNENSDFVVFTESGKNPSGGRPSKEYALTLDMAKELAMVERNEAGKRVRQYFIACEQAMKESALTATVDYERIGRQLAPIVADSIRVAIATLQPSQATIQNAVRTELSAQTYAIRCGRTAGQIYRDAGFPPIKGIAGWLGNRLAALGFSIDGQGKAQMGNSTARLFDPDKASAWLRAGGRLAIEQKIAERQGQGSLRLVSVRS